MEFTAMPADFASRDSEFWADEAEFLSAIVETQRDIAAVELDLPTILQMVADRTQRLTGADGAAVQINEGDQLVFGAVSGIMKGYGNAKVNVGSSLAGYAFLTGREAFCDDTADDSRVNHALTDRIGVRSIVVVPFFRGEEPVGILNVCSARRAAFRPRHIAALRLMAGLVSAAIAHAHEFAVKKALLAERTKALAALRDSEAHFRSAFDHAAIGMALVGIDGRWLQVNRSLCQIVGYSQEELLARDFQSITHPDDLEADLANVRRLLKGEIVDYQMIKRYIRRDGQLVWVLLSVSLVRDAQGQPLHFISQIQDVTSGKRTEDALRASAEEYRVTFEMAGVGKSQLDLQTGRIVRVNKKLCETLGYTMDELLAKTASEITHPEDAAVMKDAIEKMRRGELVSHCVDKRFLHKDGRVVWTMLNSTALTDAEGRPVRCVSTIQDITDRKRAEWLERDRRQVLEMVARDLPLPEVMGQLARTVDSQIPGYSAAVMIVEDENVLVQGLGLSPQSAAAMQNQGMTLIQNLCAHAEDSPDHCGVTSIAQDALWANLRIIGNGLEMESCWVMPIKATGSKVPGILAVFGPRSQRPQECDLQTMDMTTKLAGICLEHHQARRELRHLVRHDPLTGLPNRILFNDRFQQALLLARRRAEVVAVMLLDVDKFKSINDTFGHDAGDQLLQEFARRLRSRLRDADTMARLGGDEFAVVLPGLRQADEAALAADRMIGSLRDPIEVSGTSVMATVSIGIALFPVSGMDETSLLKKADEALYRVKERGRNGFAF